MKRIIIIGTGMKNKREKDRNTDREKEGVEWT